MRAIGAFVAGAALAFGAPLAANDGAETRAMPEGSESPPASADQLDWLVGDWAGPGVRGHRATETWTAPYGGTMVGTFVQTNEDGSIRFTEHMYIRPVGDSLEIAIKHFNPDLTGWEEKNEAERYQLVAIEECAAFFDTFTIRCDDKADPAKGIVIAVAVGEDDGGKTRELVFRYGPATLKASSVDDCAGTIRQTNACLTQHARQAEQRRMHYLTRALGRFSDNDAMMNHLREADELFLDYVTVECDRGMWGKSGGDADYGPMMKRCQIALYDRRTHDIWRNWLTFDDGTPPLLPEPAPMR
ncbi:MAG: DUF6265 family protein [Pseudomonadota bacterium]